MAEEELNIIEEEDAVAGLEVTDEEEVTLEEDHSDQDKKKKMIIIAAAAGGFFILLLLILIMSSSDETVYVQEEPITEELQESLERKKVIPPSQLEVMIKKANLLYAQGNKKEALYLFKQIALHSESISHYNLGVARMKNRQFEQAIAAFKKAIEQNDRVCVSAINAAISALKLGNKELFDYYIDLADASLVNENHSPLFSYYQGLINYYRDHHLEALSSLEHQTSGFFKEEQDYMRAKLAFAMNDPLQSITYLERAISDDDLASLGMLYARLGNLELAKKMLLKALEGGYAPVKNSLALAHVYMKMGLPQEASTIYKSLYDKNEKDYTTIYPLKVTLHPDRFDLKKLQQEYKRQDAYDDMTDLAILLHFAPYKIFDAAHTLGFIKKGSANIYIDDIESAQTYLSKGTHYSKVNSIIAEAINDALNKKLHTALNKLETVVKSYPKHSILNYNLALTYAKLGNLKDANIYFTRSYNLDAKNYMAGILATLSGKLIGKENLKQKQLFKENLDKEIETADIAFVKALFSFADRNYPSVVNWSEEQKIQSSMQNALMVVTAKKLGRTDLEKRFSADLTHIAPRDVLAHMLYIHSNFRELDNKDFTIESLKYIKNLHLTLNDLFYGSHITQKLFIEYTFITGHLYDLALKLQRQMIVESKNIIGIMQALALSNIYLMQFEQSFTLYNRLIDEHKQRDSQTLFYAALAATGADHHANASALLELANLKNRFNMESRYALALLYLEAKNYNGAAIQLGKILKPNFKSKFYTFDIDTRSIGSSVIEVGKR